MMIISNQRHQWHQATLTIVILSLLMLGLTGCQFLSAEEDHAHAASAESESADAVASGHGNHTPVESEGHRAEIDRESPIELNPDKGQEIGTVFEAFLSPHQEGGEEEDTPSLTPDVFKSTAPSVPRDERQSRGHGILSFTNDLSKAYVHVAIEGVDPEDVVMFHIHCGRPGQLGPIIIDFAHAGDLQQYLEDNILTLELTNHDIEAVVDHANSLVGAFTDGCPIVATIPTDKVKTIAGMETIAREGHLYFNLHTKGQTFFGDIRGQLHQVAP
ncbi:MAG: CHRD domain-containing protein [Chloroflexota bacterium]